MLAQEQAPIIGTVFEAPIYKLKDGTVGITGPQLEDTNPTTYNRNPTDGFGSASKYKPEMSIPAVLGLATTDKTSRGVFEAQPMRYNPVSIYNKSIDSAGFPLDATPLNNDAHDGLMTYRPLNGSPLGIGYTGGNAYQQGTDPQFVSSLDVAPVEQKPSEQVCGSLDILCKFRKVKGEATILIVGVIVLAIGIFALTR